MKQAPRLPALAAAFNARVKGYKAVTKESFVSTDRKISGTRLSVHGKGRKGFEITVRNADGETVVYYNTAFTYATNKGAAEELERFWGRFWEEGSKLPQLRCFKCRARENAQTRGKFVNRFSSPGLICPKCANQEVTQD